MPTDNEELNLIKRLCILNFLELQEIKRKMSITTENRQDFYDYPESVTIPPAPSTAPINIPRCLPTAPPIDANDAQSQ